MKCPEIKKLIISSLASGADAGDIARQLENAGLSYDFNEDFTDKVTARIFRTTRVILPGVDFMRSISSVFYRVAFTGVAAIVLLLISIFLMEGSLSLNSFLGISETCDESIVYLITGN